MNTQAQISDFRASTRSDGASGRRQRRFTLRPLAFALAGASMLSVPGIAISPAQAQAAGTLPSGLNVVAGQASAVVNGQQMTVTNSANSILNWQNFSIGSNNGVYFAQPDSASKVLNRVVGNDPSSILGSLGSNGQVWLLNPNGVLFGQGARVDVGGLVTSTLRLNDVDWLTGRYRFSAAGSDPAAGIVNQGELRSSLGGRIALLGGSVRNEGLIDSPDGQVVLAAGRSIELIDTGTPNLRLRVTAPDGEAMNLGTLAAAGGRIDVHAAMVNQQGIVRADGLGTNAAGEIVLQASNKLDLGAGSVTSASGATGGKVLLDAGSGGTTMLEGDVLATASAGSGGQIKALGGQIGLIGAARLDVTGRSGGEVFVGGGERGEDASIPNSRAVFIGQDTSISADALGQGDGGRIVLWSNEATRAYGSFSARGGSAGGNGGFIETSGGWIDIRPARLDATAAAGSAGTWLLDPWNMFMSDFVEVDNNVTVGPNFTATGSPSEISTSSIITALNNGNSVVISTGVTGTEAGDIVVQRAGINVAPNVPVSLTLQAARNIDMSFSQIVSTGAGLSVNLNAAGSGVGYVFIGSVPIVTAGGSIFASGVGRSSEGFNEGIGVYIAGSSLNAGNGNITLVGNSNDLSGLSSGRSGIAISSATLTGRDLSLTGNHAASNLSGSYGIDIFDSTVTASHALSLRGTASSIGVSAEQSTVAVAPAAFDPTASLFIDGTSTWSDLSATDFTNFGVVLAGGGYGGTLRASNGATIDVTGRHMGGSLPSLLLANALVVDAATGGDARFTANSPLEISANMVFGGHALFQGDDVTILAGSTIQSTATGDAIVIAGKSGPNTATFVNNAGAGALTTPNGRWLIYGQNTATLNPGGLNYTFKQYNARHLEANPLTPATGNGLLYAEAPVVIVRADPFSKVYDGTTAAGPLNNINLAGQRDGDIGNVPAGTSGNFNDPNAGLNKAITIDPTSVTFTDTTGRPVLGYGLATNIQGDIVRRNVSLTDVTAANKVYDGNTVASVTAGLNNLVGSETLETALTGNFDTKDAGLSKLVTVSATLSDGTNGGLASNYVLAPAGTSTTADITRRQLTGSFTATNKVYDGNTIADVTLVGFDNLVTGETLNATTTGNFNTKDVGNAKPVTVNVALADGGGGGLASNYLAPVSGGTNADITPKTVTASSVSAADKVYDGNTSATVIVGPLAGLVGSETLGTTASGTFDTKDAGTGKTVTVGTTLSDGTNGGLASNYTLAPTGTTTADITRRQLNGNFTAADKVYDGNTVANVSLAGLGNLVGNETLNVTTTGNFNTKDVGTAKPVSVNVVVANGSNGGLASNYIAPPVGATVADITPKTVTATGISAANKVYDGNTVASVTIGSLSGLVGSETLGTTASGTFDTKDAGTGKTVTVGTTLSDGTNGGLASNYTLAPTGTTTADITRRQLNGNFTAADKVYDGNTVANVSLAGLGNLVGNETLNVTTTGNFNTKDVGTAKPVSVNVVVANGSNGGLASNYIAPPVGATVADITPKTVTATGISAANKVYDGNTVASVTIGSLSGLVGSETLGTTASGTFDTKDAGTGKTVTVGTTLSDGTNGGLASNYTLAPTGTTTADITRRQLNGNFTAADKVYDGNTVANVSLAGLGNLVGNETLNVTTTGNFNTKDVGTAKPVSVNVVVANGGNGGLASNYIAPSAAPAPNASITPATLTYTANPANKLVGAPLPPLNGSVTGFVAGETQATATTGTLAFVTPATAASPAGQFAIDGSGLVAGNYSFRQDPSNATALTVTGLAVTDTDSSTQVALTQSLASVSPQPVWSSPAEGRVFDAMQALRGNYLGQGALFRAIPVDDMSQDALTTLLMARDEYKKALFASAIRQLERDPTLADLPPCKSAQEVDNGSCLITEDLKRELKAHRAAVQVAATPAPASTPAPSPAPAPAPSTDTAIAIPPALPREGVGGSAVAETVPIFASRRVRTAALPQIARKIAVVIGINRYADRRMPQLENAVGDAQAIGKVLEDQLGYETVILENASKASVVRTLNRLAIELEARDSVVVYYAGHGELIESTGLGYWQLSDSNPTRPETWLSNADISRTIAKISADQVAVISDSCYSGSLVDERIRATAGTVDPQQLLSKKSVVVMSSGGNEPVFDEGKNGHSPFAYNLMRNLEQVNNWQIGGNLFERVRFAVARQLPQRPLYGAAAAAGHQPGGDYLFEQRQLDK